ncbi:unnamed protein product [Caenorhabditis sp. 36 PRJEB53466]|nr:unnamed protein product [Caenorhabditis sp. 36 PRJEB53466]
METEKRKFARLIRRTIRVDEMALNGLIFCDTPILRKFMIDTILVPDNLYQMTIMRRGFTVQDGITGRIIIGRVFKWRKVPINELLLFILQAMNTDNNFVVSLETNVKHFTKMHTALDRIPRVVCPDVTLNRHETRASECAWFFEQKTT